MKYIQMMFFIYMKKWILFRTEINVTVSKSGPKRIPQMSSSNSLRLENDIIIFPPTFISSRSKSTLKIINDDTNNACYEWRRYSTEEEENKVLNSLDALNPADREKAATILLFSSPILRIYPLTGEIWAKQSDQILAEFQPNQATTQSITAYLYNVQNGTRIPYVFQCEGLPAMAEFNIDQINLGHVSLDRRYEYKILLKNSGKIPLEFQLMQKELEYLVFGFNPSRGHLGIGESIPIYIVLEADHVGQFNETFEYKILGLEDRPGPKITLYGRVIGPTFNVSVKKVEFGTVSYGFLYTQDFEIQNTSDIPLDFQLNLSPNKSFESREFKIIPNHGTVQPFGRQKIKVDFIPISIQDYSVQLFFDSEKFEDRLLTLPITATCVCPEICFKQPEIDLGDIFLNHKNITHVVLQNKSKYSAKFEFVECDDQSTLEATCVLGKYSGILPPNTDSEVPVHLTAHQLGHLRISRYVRIFGSDKPPIMFTFKCLCTGPKIKLSTKLIEYGVIEVLQTKEAILEIFNDSTISAHFQASVESQANVFSLPITSGEIKPKDTLAFPVHAYLDDALSFKGKITLIFKLLTPIVIDVTAKGKGTSIVSSIDLGKLDMGYLLTGGPIFKKFELTNKSRRNQEVKWSQVKPTVKQTGDTVPYFTYSLEPDDVVIHPNQVVPYTLKFDCNAPCSFDFMPTCESIIDKTKLEIFKPKINGEFIKPTIKFDQDSVVFKYVHDIKKEEELTKNLHTREVISPSKDLLQPISTENTITNVSELPLVVEAQVPSPFQISPSHFQLDPLQTMQFSIIFKTDFKKDFTSQTIDAKIAFILKNNPHKFFIDVRASMHFPNIEFDCPNVNFGSLLRNTDESKTIKMTNSSAVPVSFMWELLPKRKGIEIAKIFDVYPIRGEIDVGESQETHIVFFTTELNGIKDHEGLAVCHVVGGPDYTLELKGSSCLVDYQISRKIIDFGIRHFADTLTSSFSLTNSSDIPLSYRINIPKGSKFAVLSVEPASGNIDVGKQQEFKVRVIPGFPQSYREQLFVQIGKVYEAELSLKVDCIFPQVMTNLPRIETVDKAYAMAKNLMKPHISLDSLIASSEKALFMERLTNLKKSTTNFKTLVTNMGPSNLARVISSKYSGFVLSNFEIDFGKMTLGEVRSFDYNFKNITDIPISFEIATSSIEGTGFLIEPTSFNNIPKDVDLQVTISFDASRRTMTNVGKEEYSIPIVFSADHALLLDLKIVTAMPSISISKTNFEFDSTLLGQSRTLTLQVSNPINIPVEFQIGEAKSTTVLKKRRNLDANVFCASPKSGILPPASFQNIEIRFSPTEDKNYSMQIPICARHSTDTSYLTLKGSGMQMKVVFSKPVLKFNQLMPYNDYPVAEIEMTNPCNLPITVFAPQFDFKILCEQLSHQFKVMTENDGTAILPEESTPKLPTSSALSNRSAMQSAVRQPSQLNNGPTNTISKFSMCIIVNGPPFSGKTTMSKFISEYLGGIPIVTLKDIWANLLLNPESTSEDYINAFTDATSKGDCVRGFVIDGLNVFEESPETGVEFQNLLKNKKLIDELNKNPFTPAPYEPLTAAERATEYILAGLTGQYLFHIALQAKEDAIQKHQLMADQQNKKSKEDEENKEIEKIMNMDEENYAKLSPEEQEEIDKKRQEIRQKLLLEKGLDLDESQNEPLANNKKNAKGNTRAGSQKSRLSTASRSRKGKPSPQPKKPPPKPPANKDKKGGLLGDSMAYGIVVFNFSLGRLVHKIQTSNGKFQAIASEILKGEKNENLIQSVNSLLLDSEKDIEPLQEEIRAFLPKIKDIKETALTRLMPKEQIHIPSYFSDGEEPHLMEQPKHFKLISTEEPGEFPVFERYATPIPANAPKGKRGKVIVDESLTEYIDPMDYTKRWTLEPGQSEKLQVQYIATDVGEFEDYICFCIEDCRNDIFKFKVVGSCSYPDVDRSPQSIFQNRVAPKLTNKTDYMFIEELGEFHFGSLSVAGKERGKKDPFLYSHPLTFTNNSIYDVELSAFLQDISSKTPWGLDKNKLNIPPGESGEINIHLHPTSQVELKNAVKIFIKDNPEPFLIKFSADACLPTLELSSTNLDFERLLLSHERKLEIILKNPLKIPSFWRLKNSNQLAPNFMFNEIEGMVAPRGQSKLIVTYSSSKPIVLKKQIQLDVMDKMKLKTYISHHITLSGESFDLPFEFLYPKGFDHINIGTLKVNQSKTFTCTLKNKGKHPSKYVVSYVKPNYESFLKVEEIEGILNPSEKPRNLVFNFCSKKVSKFEHEKFLNITFYEPESGTEVGSIQAYLTAGSVYSQYKIEPEGNISFGSKSVDEKIVKEWKITNIGTFPFDFELLPKIEITEPSTQSPIGSRAGRGRGRQSVRKSQPKAPKRPRNAKEMQISNFFVSPAMGTVQPEQTMTIKVEYVDNEPRESEGEMILKVVDVSPRDPANNGKNIIISGKTFIPGIVTNDIETIFPNQLLCMRYDLNKKDAPAFLEDEQIFHFSANILNQSQNVDISLKNTYPIPCVVDTSVKPPNASNKKSPQTNKKVHSDPNFPFELSAVSVAIPPLEEKNVTLTFNPKIEGKFSAVFEATVRGGTNPDTKMLKFGVEGVGTLPSIKLGDNYDQPLSFGRTLVNTKKQKKIALINDGIVPTHVSFHANGSPDFFIDNVDIAKDIEIDANRTFLLSVTYSPKSVKQSDYSVHITAVENPDINFTLNFVGTSFIEDIIFDGFPGDENVLSFRDNIVGKPMQKTFMMRNLCDNDVRFTWIDQRDFVFSPRVGHLRKGRSKTINVTFFKEEPVSFENLEIHCQWAKIALNDPKSPDWDDSMKTVTFVPRSQLLPQLPITPPNEDTKSRTGVLSGRKFPPKKPSNASNTSSKLNRSVLFSPRRKSRKDYPTPPLSPSMTGVLPPLQPEDSNELIKVVEVKPEPSHSVIPGNYNDLILLVTAVSDYIKYETSTNEITFASTMMYETRVAELEIKNTSNIRFDYTWVTNKFSALHSDYAMTHRNPFSVLPVTGFIPAGETTKFQVRFSPEEVDDFSSHLTCEIPFLSKLDPPDILVSGYSKRPLVHFNVDLSDYLSAGRRHPDYSYTLPDDVRVIEIISSGVGKRTSKKFQIINATSNPYEIKWVNDNEHKSSSIICESARALVSSGKRYSISFSYNPTSAKTVESLWTFYIPEHGIVVPFLIVGRIMPP
ncbi:hypothetical protein TRFO_16696 [Tritrichomonas foetus]|uniref:MSP domain-containing protein n=1 Tax=Tritrichomonas foetus TaxID=1144522 RepID=A0A1J4KPM7_9EUKA|nr:hypothetical protein TRFO_16696 [Tritrichomonas foetus]|eukprot:OHT13247.1 hypothetical protein TRFO_16696 [Tritrichomonas foetus]